MRPDSLHTYLYTGDRPTRLASFVWDIAVLSEVILRALDLHEIHVRAIAVPINSDRPQEAALVVNLDRATLVKIFCAVTAKLTLDRDKAWDRLPEPQRIAELNTRGIAHQPSHQRHQPKATGLQQNKLKRSTA